MTDKNKYQPPQVWQWENESDEAFSNINRPVSGPTYYKELPVGAHPLQLYSMATPNGVKVTIMLEELLESDYKDANYDAWLIQIGEGDQFSSGFVSINPNSKIPAMVDYHGKTPVRVFETGAILLYLAEKFDAFLPDDHAKRTETLNWLFWQQGATPFVGGGFGHFYAYAPEKLKYPIDRYTMETKRQLDVLNHVLSERDYIAGDDYSIADIAIYPWYGALVEGRLYDAATFLAVDEYPHVQRWAKSIAVRPAVKRGLMVNRTWGEPSEQLYERHNKDDFELRTQDKI
ncbi:MAG: glutathione-dependent disulfide-bond oxidoreductase [Methylophaga sp.]|nr:glutathione-dependent disulfide-bond oxidoreductase [Methylophaga sp.]